MLPETTISKEHAEISSPTALDRAAALGRWRADQKVGGGDHASLSAAAEIARIFMSEDGPAFDPAQFADLVDFIEELPF